MSLVTLRNILVSYGGPPLLDHIDLQIDAGERLCLVGRNGAGKSTLMKLLSGDISADDGEFVTRQGLKISRLKQEVPHDTSGSVFDVIASGLGELGQLLSRYHQASARLMTDYSDAAMAELSRAQQALEAKDGWSLEQKVETVVSKLALPADAEFSQLSGGLKRRVLLAQALVTEPDVLLLDEPTNHLDVEAIEWLEQFLLDFPQTILFITHDRMLLQKLATRIIELDRGRLTSWPGNYQTYLERKQALLDAEAKENALFDKKLAQEEAWIRQGIKARRTRNEGRVRALKAMREEFKQRRVQQGKARMQLQGSERSGKMVAEVEGITHNFGDKPIVRDFSTTIMRGDKIGVLGPNGAGKTTLLRILLGQLEPQQGTVKLGTKLEVAYFDQHRAILDDNKTVFDNVGDGSDNVFINGQARHVMSYLQDFLFAPDRVRQPVSALSGGERNRLLLAKLFARPSNVLVLDEPTNDLDVETLELLEELLLDYAGTVLVVSHDRAFVNNVVTHSIVFEGDGVVNEYVGGYDDSQRQRETRTPAKSAPVTEKKAAAPVADKPKPAKKLSYKDQRELDALPAKIEELENKVAELQQQMADPAVYQQAGDQVSKLQAEVDAVEAELTEAYARWEQLEELQNG